LKWKSCIPRPVIGCPAAPGLRQTGRSVERVPLTGGLKRGN